MFVSLVLPSVRTKLKSAFKWFFGIICPALKKLDLALEEKIALEEKSADFVKKIAELEKELEKYRVLHEYVKYSGILFRKIAYENTEIPYCPTCMDNSGKENALFCNNRVTLVCSICGYRAPVGQKSIGVCVGHLVSSGEINRTDEQLKQFEPRPTARVHAYKPPMPAHRRDDRYLLWP